MTAAAESSTLYSQVVSITQEYLGPAAERFISRQIQMHLNKKPQNITKQDIPALTNWVKIAISLLTEDTSMVETYTQSLLKLAK